MTNDQKLKQVCLSLKMIGHQILTLLKKVWNGLLFFQLHHTRFYQTATLCSWCIEKPLLPTFSLNSFPIQYFYVHRLATVFRNRIIFPSFFPIPLLAYCYILKKSPVLSELLSFKSIKGTYCPGRGFKQLESIVCWSNFMFAHT